MRVLIAHNEYRQRGGEDRAVEAETALLTEHGHHVVRYTARNDSVRELGSLALARTTLWSTRAHADVSALIRCERIDVVHVHNTLPLISPSVYYAARDAGVPVVQTLHNYRLLCVNALFLRDGRVCEDCLNHRSQLPGVVHACYRGSRAASAAVAAMNATHRAIGTWRKMVDVYIALTEFARRKFVEGGLPEDRVVVKPHFVPHGPPHDGEPGNYALFVGRLSPEKGVDTLLTAWQHVGRRLPLKIVGEGPLGGQVSAAAAAHPAIEWLGAKSPDAVAALMRGARVVVVPSICYEAFGLVIAEAFAAGRLVIASDLGSMASLVTHRATGLLCPPRDAQALAATVEWALAHSDDATAMSAAGYRYYQECLTPEHNYILLMAVYRAAALRAQRRGSVHRLTVTGQR